MVNVEVESISERSTEDIFEVKLRRFAKENPEEFELLKEKLENWGPLFAASGVSREEHVGDMIIFKIDDSISRSREAGFEITAEERIDELFSEGPDGIVSADMIMGKIRQC